MPFRLTDLHGLHIVWLAVLLCSLLGRGASAQALTEPPGPELSVVNLEKQRKELAENETLSEDNRKQLDDLYAKAIERLKEATAQAETTSQLATELETANEKLEQVQQDLAAFTPAKLPDVDPASTPDDLMPQLTAAEAAQQEARAALDVIEAEIARRSTLRTQLPTLRTEAQQQLEMVKKELTLTSPESDSPELTAARRDLLLARQRALQTQLALIDQQQRTYEATAKLWSLRRDLADRRSQDAERIVAVWQNRVSAARRMQAERAAAQARRTAANAHPAVKVAADRNAELAEETQSTLKSLDTTREQIDQVSTLKDSLENTFEGLKKRAEAAQFSQAIGILLRNQRAKLPDTGPYIQRSRERQAEIGRTNLRLIEWESERQELIDPTQALAELMDRIPASTSDTERADIETELKGVLSRRLELLATAIENGNQYLDRMVALDSLEKGLVAAANSQSEYIAEHVLWVKSTEALDFSTFSAIVADTRRLLNVTRWRETAATVKTDITSQPAIWALCTVLAIWLALTRARMRKSIRESGQAASRSSATEIKPTVRALFHTLALASLVPACLWFFGWRLSVASPAGFTHYVGASLRLTAGGYFALELVRQMLRQGGVCHLHFKWPERSVAAVRHVLSLSMIPIIPAVWVVAFSQWHDSDAMDATIGRVAFVLSTLVASWAFFILFRPRGVIAQSLALDEESTLLMRTRPLWSTFVILAPLSLGLLSLAGFHYTALQLTGRLLATIGLIAVLVVVRAFLHRWLLVTYRRLAIKRSRERREQLLKEAAERAEADEQPDIIEPEPVPEVSLADVNQQTRSLIRLGAGLCLVIGLWIIWIDILPALGILRNVELWPNQITGSIDAGDSVGIPMVTLAELVLAIAAGLLTIIAARNIPGLMEIAILQRLPLDAGARYAASSLTRYGIAVLGVTLAFRLIGIGWSSVQWLIAAMTVGLGFGLQEIFANFVSGLILLFERPVRVGDTVTVDNITGTVTRIRIRATTILDWDNKELIVPNRAFVTGNLINWTLSNPNLRLILRVGIAYGSDTRKATQLLAKVAREHPQILDDPEPVIVFQEFGESTLNFEVRLFVTGLAAYRRISHDLNLAIDDAFRDANIEIAFPQRDLHVRSFPQELLPRQFTQSSPDRESRLTEGNANGPSEQDPEPSTAAR